jgi:hypothetical protein
MTAPQREEPPMRYVEWRRHSDNGAIALPRREPQTPRETGRDLPHPPYDAFVSTGAACATQMLEIVRHAVGQDDTPITPTMSARARGTAQCTWFTVSCMASPPGLAGGWDLGPAGCTHASTGPLSY